jgi:hypothetical protein
MHITPVLASLVLSVLPEVGSAKRTETCVSDPSMCRSIGSVRKEKLTMYLLN